MPRPVVQRTSYRRDAAFLLRFEESVGLDTDQPEEWRREVRDMIRKLVQKILTAQERLQSAKQERKR